jgi:hypothetical protein
MAVRPGKKSFAAAVLLAGLAIVPLSGAPAGAAGKSETYLGCYAQWWNTAFAGYCYNTPQQVTVRLNADCSLETDYAGPWRTIHGTVAPFDNSECRHGVRSAWLGFK